MDINQITEELDTLFAQEKIGEIPQFLESHIAQAAQEGAQEVLLTLYNEIIGFYRETGQYALSIENCHKAVALMKEMGIQDTIPYATTLLNIANAHRAAGLLQESLELYNRVRPIYVAHLDENDMYFANFYNNLSLLYQEMGDFASAKDQLVNALSIVSHKPDRQFEAAVTQANLANTCIELGQDDEARARAEEAIRIFEELGVDDAHYSAALSALGSLYYMDKDYNSALRAMEKSRECVAKYLGTDNIQYQRLSENIEIIQDKIRTSEKPSESETPAQEETAAVSAVEASEPESLGELPVEVPVLENLAEVPALETLAAEASELETLVLSEEMPVLEAFVPEKKAEPAGVSEQEAFVETPEESEQESKPSQTSVQESFTETPEAEGMPAEEVEQEAESGGSSEAETFVLEESGQEAASGEVPELETAVLEESEQESELAQTSVEESPTEVSESEEEVFVAEASVNTSEVEAIPIEESNGEAAVEVLSTEEPALEPVLEEPKKEAFAEAPLTETLEQAASPAKSPEQEDLTPSITGIDLCRRYYEEYGRPMIAGKFQAYESRIAVGLVGKGSDCFGFDDVLSQDHDFGPRFVMWVTKKVYDEIGEELQEAYDKLPSQFLGIDRIETFHGKDRSGVMIIEEFYKSLLGFDLAGMLAHNNEDTASGKENLDTIKCWLSVQEYALAAAVNGEVFRDDEGIFTQYRNLLSAYYPKAVWYRKVAQTCALFSQSGQYNLPRMRRRGQLVSAELAKAECAKQAMKLYYLLNRKYAPHDKWLYRGMPENAQMTLSEEGMENADVPKLVEKLSLLPADKAHEAALTTAVESLAVIFANELEKLNMVGKCDLYLDVCTKELMTKSDALLTAIVANTPIVTALSLSIAKSEFEAFDKVQNEGGRASCQNNWPTFKVMRMSQYMTWTEDMLLQYLYEFKTNYANGRNMIEEKYARMMESTAPLEYARFAKRLPAVSEAKKAIVEQIVALQVKWMEEFAAQYPNLAEDARAIHTAEDLAYDTSYETYLRGELRTYSDRMLEMYGRYIVAHAQAGKNVACEIMKNTVQFYGYQDLETANAKSAN
jgi:tetratricopeptide (TPR) repeat protein